MKIFYKTEFRAVWDVMKPDVFTTRLFFDPLAVPVTILFSKISWITANRVTFAALLPGLVGAWYFASGRFGWGAAAYYLFFLLDSVDGKLARLREAADPLGAFYDFVVDRIVIGAMVVGMSWSFVHQDLLPEFLAVQLFLLIFFLKDVLDLKWKESQAFRASDLRYSESAFGISQKKRPGGECQKKTASAPTGFFARHKIHFKPGQLLSCFILFIAGPLSGRYVLCAGLAIGCVALSLAHNVLIPLVLFLRAPEK